MSTLPAGERKHWLVAAGVAGVSVVALLWLFRLPSPPTPSPTPIGQSKSSVEIARPGPGDRLLQEETEIRDLRPLFLPTERNATLPEPLREPGRTFLDDEGFKPTYAEADPHVARGLPPVATVNGKPVSEADPVDALTTQGTGATLLGFGRRRTDLAPFGARGGFVEVVAMSDGRGVLAAALPAEARPPGDKAWAPVEFLAAVDAAGLMSPLVVTEGSRVEEVDAYFKNFLTLKFRVGEKLAPGFYRISVAP